MGSIIAEYHRSVRERKYRALFVYACCEAVKKIPKEKRQDFQEIVMAAGARFLFCVDYRLPYQYRFPGSCTPYQRIDMDTARIILEWYAEKQPFPEEWDTEHLESSADYYTQKKRGLLCLAGLRGRHRKQESGAIQKVSGRRKKKKTRTLTAGEPAERYAMNEKILRHKSVLAFADAAKTVERHAAKKAVVLTRMYAVSLIDSFIAASDKADSFSRRIRKRGAHLPERGLQIAVVNPYAEQKRKLHGMLVTTGEMLFYALYIWQQAGGTFQELCNLCNISEEYGRKSMEGIDGDTFPSILFVCALDYKDTGDWIECTPDAPMTICIKEYMLDQLIHTKHGQCAAHEALGKVFPNLEGHAIYRIVDNEGNVHYVDNDGAELPLTEK